MNGSTLAWIVAATVVGACLRGYRSTAQILSGDEWHSINVALSRGFGEIFSTFVAGSHSIPVALYDRLVLHAAGLSEVTIALPFLLAGSALVPLLPWMVRKLFPPLTLVLFAWLLATAPLLVFYSRFARPYGIVALLAFTAVVAFHRWWVDGSRAAAALYLALTGLCAWFHLVALPFLGAPFLWAAVQILFATPASRQVLLRRVVWMGVGAVAVMVLLLGAPMLDGVGAIGGKSGRTSLEFSAAASGLWVLLNGAGHPAVAVLLALAAALSWVSLPVQGRGAQCLRLLLVASLVQLAAVAVSRPLAVNGPHIFARYLIPALPALLLTAATGVERLTAALRLQRWAAAAASVLVVGLVFATGPLPATILQPSNAGATHLLAAMIFGPDFESRVFDDMTVEVPQLYRELAQNPRGSMVLAEAPYHYDGYHLLFYQRVHRQEVVIGLITGLCSDERKSEKPVFADGMRLERFVRLDDPAAVAAKGVDLVVFHRDLHAEISYEPEHDHLDTTECIEAFANLHGPPVYEDAFVVAFDVRHEEAGPDGS